jgi:hypothetical protein
MDDTVKRVLKECNVRVWTALLSFWIGKCMYDIITGMKTQFPKKE